MVSREIPFYLVFLLSPSSPLYLYSFLLSYLPFLLSSFLPSAQTLTEVEEDEFGLDGRTQFDDEGN